MTRAQANGPTAFQKFEALTRRILATPKAGLVKHEPKGTAAKSRPKKHK